MLFYCYSDPICRRDCEQHITSSNSDMVWSRVEVFDGKLLGLWTSYKAIVFWNLSEAEEYGCCNECEMIANHKSSPIHFLISSVSQDLVKEEIKMKHRFLQF